MSKAILFLGAGASRTFDFPTTKEFMKSLNKKLPSKESDSARGIKHELANLRAEKVFKARFTYASFATFFANFVPFSGKQKLRLQDRLKDPETSAQSPPIDGIVTNECAEPYGIVLRC